MFSLSRSTYTSMFSSPVWAIAITWRPSSVCKLLKKPSPLKPLGQFKPSYDPLSDLWLLNLIAYEKWLLSLLKIDFFIFFFYFLNIVKSQCCYQTIREQCIYNSLSDHEWWPRLPTNMAVAASQTWKLVNKISKK
jgi:hypothetical protein